MQCLITNKLPNLNEICQRLHRGFSEVTPKTKVSTIRNCTDIWLSKCTSVQISNITKVCVQNVLRVLECKMEDVDATAWSLHRWTPGGNVPNVMIKRDFSWSTSWIRLRYTRYCSFHQIWLAGKFCDEFFAPYPFSCLSTLIKTRSSAENTIFIVYTNCLQVTSDCSKQRCIGNRDILSSVFED